VVNLPQIRFLGPHHNIMSNDKSKMFYRGTSTEVSQEWLDQRSNQFIGNDNFEVSGYEPPTLDADGDGLPDDDWRRADIMDWLKERGVPIGRTYKTKTALLAMVEEHLNPPAPEPVAEVVEVEVEVEEEQTETTETMEE
jgi:hypothetical protein